MLKATEEELITNIEDSSTFGFSQIANKVLPATSNEDFFYQGIAILVFSIVGLSIAIIFCYIRKSKFLHALSISKLTTFFFLF